MKRYISILSILSILMILTIGIVSAEENTTKKADGKSLYSYITNESNYKEWQMWPGTSEFYPGNTPHGALLTTYVTDDAFTAIESRDGNLPDGSVIVKENYLTDKTLAALTVMYKEAGYDPENNDWFWARYAPNGTVLGEGKISGCIDCHIKPKENFNNQLNDYVFTSNLQAAEDTPTDTPTETTPTDTPTKTTPTDTTIPKNPGFEGIIAIVVLVSVIYLFRK